MDLSSSNMTGPSRDYHSMYDNEVQWRAEPHTIKPERVPYSLTTKPVPKTSKRPHYDLVPGRVPVLIRNSNVNPRAEGTGDTTSEWNVSASMLGQEDPGYTAPTGLINAKTVVSGLAIGFLIFRLVNR